MAFRVPALVVVLATVLVTVLRPTPAHAEDSSSRAHIRQLLIAGDAATAQAAIAGELSTDVSRAERAALLELFAVGTAWAERGAPRCIASRAKSRASSHWNDAFFAARSELIRGAYRAASGAFDDLLADAPDLVDAARAVELRALAREALPNGDERGCSARGAKGAETGASSEDGTGNARKNAWYGWQTLIADGAALVTTPFVPVLGAGLYLAGGPVVHLAHGRVGRAAGSAGIRVGLPLAGAGTGVIIWQSTSTCGGHDVCGLGGIAYVAVGGGLGIIGAVALDAALLARERAAPVEDHRVPTALLRPSLAPRREGGVDLGLLATW